MIQVADSTALAGPTPALRAVKRATDVALASLLLVVSAPLLLVAALLIKLDSPGPVLFRQKRLGRECRTFTVLKLRTMCQDAPADPHRQYIAQLAQDAERGDGLKKLVADPRVTRVGRVLRRTSIDELPQLVNVLRGQMSLVGPRPAIEYELEHYQPSDFDRFLVRPGITGKWQVAGRNDLGFREMLELDAQYARSAGLVQDLWIMLRTPLALLRARSA